MPTSGYQIITNVMGIVDRENPRSILDVGIGHGKWGFLCREHLEMYKRAVYWRKDWQVTVDGIEIFRKYRNPVWDYAYNQIHIGDAVSIVPKLGIYDLVICTEVIEHIDKRAGFKLLSDLISHSRKGVILSFPDGRSDDALSQGTVFGNVHETHVSRWTENDLDSYSIEVIAPNSYFLRSKGSTRWPYAIREGVWQDREDQNFSTGRALLASIPGSALRMKWETKFVRIRLLAFPWGGRARVSLNGIERDIIDLFDAQGKFVEQSYEFADNRGGELRLELMSARNPESKGIELWFDSAK